MFRTSNNPRPPANPYFPTFLLPSLKIPFVRRRQSSATTASCETSPSVPSLSSSPTTPTSPDNLPVSPTDPSTGHAYEFDAEERIASLSRTGSPGKQPIKPRPLSLNAGQHLARTLPDVLRCNTCGTDVAYGLQIVSKGFTGRHGRALLVAAPSATSTPSCPGSPFANNGVVGNMSISPGHHTLAQESANLVNITVGRPEPRNLVTGAHVVADINCTTCGVKIGWKYVDAREQTQKYKVGKFILETERVLLYRTWEDAPTNQLNDLSRHFYSSSSPVGSPGSSSRRRSSTFFGERKSSYSTEVPTYVEEDEDDYEDESSEDDAEEEEITFDSEDEDECEDIFAGVWDPAVVARRRNSRVSAGSHRHRSGANNKSRAGTDGKSGR